MTNITEVLSERTAAHPDAAAIREILNGRRRTTTFAQLERSASTLAAEFRDRGINPGDDVLVLHPITAELYAIVLALFRIGSTVVLLDPSAGLDHIARCCTLRPPAALVGSRKAHLLRLASGALRAIPQKFSMGSWVPGAVTVSMHSTAMPIAIEPCNDSHAALLTFTSGGTGPPKAAIRSHGFLLAQNRVLSRTLELTPGEVDLATLPVFVLANIAAGVTTVIPNCDLRHPGRIDATAVLKQIAQEQPTSTACSPAFIQRLATASISEGSLLNSFRRIYTGGAPVTPELMDLVAKAAPQAEVVAVYGSTEAEPISELPLRSLSAEERANTEAGGGLPAGIPVDEIKLRIISDNWGKPLGQLSAAQFNDLCLSPFQRGEIVVSGDHVLQGYLNGHGDNETKFNVAGTRWHRTGDAGYVDEQGRLWLLGRCHSVIRDSRGDLYPFAVEMVALKNPSVARAALLYHQEKRMLFIEPLPGHKAPEAAHFQNMMPWAHLDEICILDHIPVDRRHNAKIDYPRLQAMIR